MADDPHQIEHGQIDRLSLVIFSGTYEKVHYAQVMASAALASNRAVTLFFTMEASRALLAPSGWRQLRCDAEGTTATTLDMVTAEKGIGTFEELLTACAAMGGEFMVCEMGLRALGLENQPIREDLSVTRAGAVSFLNRGSADGGMLFV